MPFIKNAVKYCKILILFFDYISERPLKKEWGDENMDDERIIDLFWQRDENAIFETKTKYGKYCYVIAYNILHSHEDSEECINDTWNSAWNAIPPAKPKRLQSFLARITRNTAIDRCRYDSAQKRDATIKSTIDEYFECIPNKEASIEDEIVLKRVINEFLFSLDTKTRVIFMRRYWYSMQVKEIANGMGLSENHISIILHRTREKFKEHLTKEGIF